MRGGSTARAIRTLACSVVLLLAGCGEVPVLSPYGSIAVRERNIIIIAFAVMMLVAVPVFVMTFLFAWRYRASNTKARYAPHWGRSKLIDLVIWLVPAIIVAALGGLEWHATHTLNPYRPIASAEKPVEVDVIAMDWKWLFIYPREGIAAVNQLVIPTGRPVSFRLTSETVMASFFIPALGSQIYAMPGMRTKLHLITDRPGSYVGHNYQFSGRGFSRMDFQVLAMSASGFHAWISEARKAGHKLDAASLVRLEQPSVANPVVLYSPVTPHLFDAIISGFHGHPPRPATLARKGS